MSEQEQDQAPGTTPETVTDDAAEAALGAPVEEADRSADTTSGPEGDEGKQDRTDWKRMALEYKGKVEAYNELRREMEAARQREVAQPPTNYQAAAQEQQSLALLAQSIQEAQYEAQVNAGTPEGRRAALSLATLQQTYAIQQQLAVQRQLLEIPQEHHRAVLQKLQTGRYADAAAAFDAVEVEMLRKQRDELTRREKDLTQAQTRQSRGVVGSGRPVPVSARELDNGSRDSFNSPTEYQAEHARIFNEHGPAAARAFAQRQMRGEVKVKGL